MKIVLFYFIIFICSGCSVRNREVKDMSIFMPELKNEVLKKNIIEYVKENSHEMSPYIKNLIRLDVSFSGDTVVYEIQYILNLEDFLSPKRVSAILKVDSIYIGYRNLSTNDAEMPLKAIIDILSKDYPWFEDDYAVYLKCKEQQKQSKYPNVTDCQFFSFFKAIGCIDGIWTLKFVNNYIWPNILMSKSVYSECEGTLREEFFSYDDEDDD